jgi:hypothetical protein
MARGLLLSDGLQTHVQGYLKATDLTLPLLRLLNALHYAFLLQRFAIWLYNTSWSGSGI